MTQFERPPFADDIEIVHGMHLFRGLLMYIVV
jgi:hypothetical protein